MPQHAHGGPGGSRAARTTVVAVALAAVLALVGVALLVSGLVAQEEPPRVAGPGAGVSSSDPAAPRPGDGTAGGDGEVGTADPAGPVLSPSPPTELAIPAIGVRHELAALGTTPEGTMEVPPLDAVEVPGWYTGSPTPGARGPSILLGHVDSAQAGPGVFFRLGELRPGDRVEVDRRDGLTAEFVVEEVGRYPKSDFPTLDVYRNLDHAGLRLITCGGPFDERTGDYRDNVVVFARMVGTPGA